MAKFFIADEVNSSNTADVLRSGALETAQVFTNVVIPSGAAYGTIYGSAAYLHSVVVGNTGNSRFNIFDIGGAGTGSSTNSASAVCTIDTNKRGAYLFDVLVAGKLDYRLTADCDGITVSYQIA